MSIRHSLVGLVAFCLMLGSGLAGSASAQDLQKRIDRTVRERGQLESARSVELRSEVAGTTTILHIVPEGMRARKGDLLVELDSSLLEEKLAERRVALAQAEAGLVKAKELLDNTKLTTEMKSESAELRIKLAELEYERHTREGGQFDLQVKMLDDAISLAKRRVALASRRLERLTAAGDRIPAGQREEAELALVEAEIGLSESTARKKLFVEHERVAQQMVLELQMLEAKQVFEQSRQQMVSSRRQAETSVVAAEAFLRKELAAQEHLQKQLLACKIRAPQDGVVVYARPTGRANTTLLEAGAQVRERQTILRLPDMSKLLLNVMVHESRIGRVKVGQQATVLIDAYPDRRYSGRVTKVNTVPEPTSWLNARVKEYSILVSIDQPIDGLKLGMTGMAEIATEKE